jgi:hypothetical protein
MHPLQLLISFISMHIHWRTYILIDFSDWLKHFKYLVQLQVTKSNDLTTIGTDILPKSNDGTLVNESVIADAAGSEKLVEVNGPPTSSTQPPADSSSNWCVIFKTSQPSFYPFSWIITLVWWKFLCCFLCFTLAYWTF